MTSSYPFQADIRKYRIGGWESAKVSAKVNGKWVYLYNSENNKLLNCPELIRFERKYVPPSDTSDISTARKRPISVYDDVDRTITNEVRAPLQYKSTKKKKKFLSPVVYGSFYNQFRNTSNKSSQNYPRKTATSFSTQKSSKNHYLKHNNSIEKVTDSTKEKHRTF